MGILSLFKTHFASLPAGKSRIYNLTGSAPAVLLALRERPFIALETDESKAELLCKDINFYRGLFAGERVFFLPDPSGPESIGQRAELVWSLESGGSLVTSSENLETSLWDRTSLAASAVALKPGTVVSRAELEQFLLLLGYRHVPMVSGKGEYSLRGWVLDLFPSMSEDPLRIEFFGDEIEQLRTFDPDSQRSRAELADYIVFPAQEPEGSRSISEIFPGRAIFSLDPAPDLLKLPEGSSLLSRYSFQGSGPDNDHDHELELELETGGTAAQWPDSDAGILSLKGCGILPEERGSLAGLAGTIRVLSHQHRVLIVASSRGQAERLTDIFREADCIAPVIEIRDAEAYEGNISIVVGELSGGVFIEGLLILTEKEIFGERAAFRSIKKTKLANLLSSLDDITPGDFVVHRDYGVGRFTGTVRRSMDDAAIELMQIDYDGGRIFIPVQNIQNISKYRAEEGVVPKVDKLGGKSWQNKKARAKKRAQEIAAKLLSLYAGRSMARGFVFSPDTELHHEFDSFFSYEETADQLRAIQDIKKDMESEKPMDRLLCGDVGYGKTEVAMRAAFKAVFDHRQVAVLVPTTILAEQHYRTFRERFSGFPVTIDFISRFKSKKETDDVLKRLSQGQVDIIIGTHGLLSSKVVFNRLGLLIIDEEHKFGVGQKEKVKELSRGIDALNLTATPIPRTLHMSLSGIRDISVIETPPEERLSVKSVVSVFDDKLIREALQHELMRGGQVFFVHNRIHDIYTIANHLSELVPEAQIGVAHGKMPGKELETVMHRFFTRQINILVSTAIVGSGLDIPRANTIIINRADRMGLADLYQLRGRVGRSSVKGYAFFIAPPESVLTEEARKRLQAVQEMSYLGAGFRLAMKDLEIRGSGDIFGAEQSGQVHEIGFDLYMEMLEQAVAEAKGIEVKEELEPVIELKPSAFIPEQYIEEIGLRLNFYRRIASLSDEAAIDEFQAELRDRFGSPPEEVISLLKIMRLKSSARRLMIMKIAEAQGKVRVIFHPDTKVQPGQILSLHDSRKGRMKFLQDGFEVDYKGADFEQLYTGLSEILQELSCQLPEADAS
ncbi:MAG: transcription-repair coupling factor [Nitrospirae bacterium]|nr:MAG: transcription-repair coupling factor [Nitrospirota bacterium]